MRPDERQLWRVLNASAITYLDLQILVGGTPQRMGVVSLDGVPVNEGGMAANRVLWETHILCRLAEESTLCSRLRPQARKPALITRSVDTGPAGENDPTRPLATIVTTADAPEPRSALPASPAPRFRSRPRG